MAATPIPPVFKSLQLVVDKRSLRLMALFSSSPAGSSVGTDMHGEMIDGVLRMRSAGSVSPLPAALTTTITARMNLAWPLAAGLVASIDSRLKTIKAPCRVGYITFNHYIGSNGKRGQELRISFSPLPGSGARSFSLVGEWGSPLHLEPTALAALSEVEFGAILHGQSVKGVDLAALGRYHEYSRPEGIHLAWLAALWEMPAITRMLHALGQP
jgi:hypothetical protein